MDLALGMDHDKIWNASWVQLMLILLSIHIQEGGPNDVPVHQQFQQC